MAVTILSLADAVPGARRPGAQQAVPSCSGHLQVARRCPCFAAGAILALLNATDRGLQGVQDASSQPSSNAPHDQQRRTERFTGGGLAQALASPLLR